MSTNLYSRFAGLWFFLYFYTVLNTRQAAAHLLQTDLHEDVCWKEDPETDGEKNPSLHPAPRILVFHQLLADLAVNLISAARGTKTKSSGNTRRHQRRRTEPPAVQ